MAQVTDLTQQFRAFMQQQALAMRSGDRPVRDLAEWRERRAKLRRQLADSWGGFPTESCPLEPRVVGQFQRDGYRVEKILLQTRPGIWMTANAYVPDGEGRRPAVLCVHGHWRLAKQEPVVQSRCIGLAKLGFFVLMVDACGAGERAVGKALGEYHGEMVAATLWPTGLALAGLQVHENMRAVDYLQSRDEVDPKRIGVTGASGGGNQTMYAGAMDDRFACVVPVCSVGTYQAYLSAACCMCEVTPGALSYTEESGVLSLVAPRALMVISATRDAFQFSVDEARKSIEAARHVFRAYDVDSHLRHAIFESGHDYNQPMREAMYGWMTRHLKGEGDGGPIPEPTIQVEDAELLRCFPADSRPDDYVTLPRFAAQEGRRTLSRYPVPDHAEHWQADRDRLRRGLLSLFGDLPEPVASDAVVRDGAVDGETEIEFASEVGITVFARLRKAIGGPRGTAIVLDLERGRTAMEGDVARQWISDGWNVVAADLRATGATAYPSDQIGRAPDHNSAEWALWIGRPLLGQWAWDVARTITILEGQWKLSGHPLALIGVGASGPLALAVAALDQRITCIATVGSLATYVTDVPYQGQRMGLIAPRMFGQVGDMGQLAALCAPRPLVIGGGVVGSSERLEGEPLRRNFEYTRAAYRLEKAEQRLAILDASDAPAVSEELKRSMST